MRKVSGKILCCAVVLLSLVEISAAGVFDTSFIGPDGGSWSDPANWSGGVVPANTATDTFNVTTGRSSPTSGYPAGQVMFDRQSPTSIGNLTVNGTVNLSAGTSLEVTGAFNGTCGVTANNAVFHARGPSSFQYYNVNIGASNGGVVRLPNLPYLWCDWDGYSYVTADGAGSSVEIPAATFIKRSGIAGMYINATNGGRIDLRSVTKLVPVDVLRVTSSGANSLIDLSSLETTTYVPYPTYPPYNDCLLTLSNGGRIGLGALYAWSSYRMKFTLFSQDVSDQLVMCLDGQPVRSFAGSASGVSVNLNLFSPGGYMDNPPDDLDAAVRLSFISDSTAGMSMQNFSFAGTRAPEPGLMLGLSAFLLLLSRRSRHQ